MAFGAKYTITLTSQNFTTSSGVDVPNTSSRTITDLHIEFRVVKDLDGLSNNLELSIFNLDEDTRNFINDKTQIELEIGYRDQPELRVGFLGQIKNSINVFMAKDIKTVITAGDGFRLEKLAYTSRNFLNKTVAQMADTILREDYGIPDVKVIPGTVLGTDYLNKVDNKRPFDGYSKDIMDDLAEANYFDWFIREGVAYILPVNKVVNETNQVVRSGVDLLTEPYPFVDKGVKRDEDPTPYQGYKFETLLNPNINIGNVVELVLEGGKKIPLKVGMVEHIGSYEGTTWKTSVTGYIVEGLKATLGGVPTTQTTGSIA